MKTIMQFIVILSLFGLVACNNSASTDEKKEEEPATKDTVVAETQNSTIEDIDQIKVNASELKASYDIPVAISYAEKLNNSEEESESPESYIQYTEFYPLGWSKEGHFAWLEYSTTYFGGYVMTYSIKDMRSNEVLWSHTNNFALTQDPNDDSEAIMDANVVIVTTEEANKDKEFELLWAFDEKVIINKLKESGIDYQPSEKYLNTAEYKGLTFSIEMPEGTDKENPFEYHIKDSKGTSFLLAKHYQEARFTEVAGILESPFDNTFGVLCLQRRQFFEMTDEIVPFVVGF